MLCDQCAHLRDLLEEQIRDSVVAVRVAREFHAGVTSACPDFLFVPAEDELQTLFGDSGIRTIFMLLGTRWTLCLIAQQRNGKN